MRVLYRGGRARIKAVAAGRKQRLESNRVHFVAGDMFVVGPQLGLRLSYWSREDSISDVRLWGTDKVLRIRIPRAELD